MTLTACYTVFNESRLIAESILSVKAYVDRYVIVDSVFKSNAVDATHSTDDTRAICERLCASVPLLYIESLVKLSEDEARNSYLAEVPHGDWLLVIDGDEVLYGAHEGIESLIRNNFDERVPSRLDAVAVPVFTTAVKFNGMGGDVDAVTYEQAARINTVGYSARFQRSRPGLEYRQVVVAEGPYAGELALHGLYHGAEYVGDSNSRTNAAFLINHHTRQSHAEYLADYAWETAQQHG